MLCHSGCVYASGNSFNGDMTTDHGDNAMRRSQRLKNGMKKKNDHRNVNMCVCVWHRNECSACDKSALQSNQIAFFCELFFYFHSPFIRNDDEYGMIIMHISISICASTPKTNTNKIDIENRDWTNSKCKLISFHFISPFSISCASFSLSS